MSENSSDTSTTRRGRPPKDAESRAPRSGRPSDRVEKGRARRVPLGAPALKLAVPQAQDDPDHVYRWINDTPGRLQRAQQAGYEFVEDPTMVVGDDDGNARRDSRVSRMVGRNEKGGEQYAYLMKIKRDWYEEDQAAKHAAIDEVDETIKRGQLNEKAGDERYIPKEGIKLS